MVNLGDPAIMRSIMHAEGGGPSAPQFVNNKSMGSFVIWFGGKQVLFFGGGGVHFSNPNEPINLCPSPGAFPTSERGEEGAEEEKRSASLFSLIFLSPTSYLLSPLISFPLTLIHALPSKASFCLFAFSEFVSSFLPSFLQHHPRRVPVMHL